MLNKIKPESLARSFSRRVSRRSQWRGVPEEHIEQVPITEEAFEGMKATKKKERRLELLRRQKKASMRERVLLSKQTKEILIDSDEAVDWFVQKFLDPIYNKSGMQRYLSKKVELQRQGLMPTNLGHFPSKQKVASEKLVEGEVVVHDYQIERLEKLTGKSFDGNLEVLDLFEKLNKDPGDKSQ